MKKEPKNQINSCDGCQRGLPIGKKEYMGRKVHLAGEDEIHIFCTKDRYAGDGKKCTCGKDENYKGNLASVIPHLEGCPKLSSPTQERKFIVSKVGDNEPKVTFYENSTSKEGIRDWEADYYNYTKDIQGRPFNFQQIEEIKVFIIHQVDKSYADGYVDGLEAGEQL